MLIRRFARTVEGTFGILELRGYPYCLTLEDPWNNNERNISCIPAGAYVARRITSPRFGNTWEIANVPGRSEILFHYGNTSLDTRGCVLLGKEFGILNGHHGILRSREAFDDFIRETSSYDTYGLTIKEVL